MISDTPIETILELRTEPDSEAASEGAETAFEPDAAAPVGDATEPPDQKQKKKKKDELLPNRRWRRAIGQVMRRMQTDVRNLGVHVLCGKPFVGPTQNRCSCTVKMVLATDIMTFQATKERGKHDV